jgi:hypothetical protein
MFLRKRKPLFLKKSKKRKGRRAEPKMPPSAAAKGIGVAGQIPPCVADPGGLVG